MNWKIVTLRDVAAGAIRKMIEASAYLSMHVFDSL